MNPTVQGLSWTRVQLEIDPKNIRNTYGTNLQVKKNNSANGCEMQVEISTFVQQGLIEKMLKTTLSSHCIWYSLF